MSNNLYMLYLDPCNSLRSCHDPDDLHMHICIGNHGWEDIEDVVYDVPLYDDALISLENRMMEIAAMKLLELTRADQEPSKCGKIDSEALYDLHPRRRKEKP